VNFRIRPDDLENAPYREAIQTLAQQWVQAKLLTQQFSLLDCATTIRTLLLTTQSLERTTTIVNAVLDQAVTLRKTSAWVDEELKFEGMIEGADRVDFLRFDLQQATDPDDALLDRFNERMNRFSLHEK
jgi:hypothetical protein